MPLGIPELSFHGESECRLPICFVSPLYVMTGSLNHSHYIIIGISQEVDSTYLIDTILGAGQAQYRYGKIVNMVNVNSVFNDNFMMILYQESFFILNVVIVPPLTIIILWLMAHMLIG